MRILKQISVWRCFTNFVERILFTYSVEFLFLLNNFEFLVDV